jgi:hypothetical protein
VAKREITVYNSEVSDFAFYGGVAAKAETDKAMNDEFSSN